MVADQAVVLPSCGTGEVRSNDAPKVPLWVAPPIVTDHRFCMAGSYDVALRWTPSQLALKLGVCAEAADAVTRPTPAARTSAASSAKSLLLISSPRGTSGCLP